MSSITPEWTKPQLVVLARGTPEESVLVNCKTMNQNPPATGSKEILYQDSCAHGEDYLNCSNCQARGFGGS